MLMLSAAIFHLNNILILTCSIINGIYRVCLSVRKWLTDMTIFTRIYGYGVHHPPSNTCGSIQNLNKHKWNIFHVILKMIAYLIISLVERMKGLF